MENYNKKGYNELSKNNLHYNHSKWNSKETIAVRIPKQFKEDVLNYAKALDSSNNTTETQKESSIIEKIENIMKKHKENLKGYKTNSSGEVWKELDNIIKTHS
jgi:hypothetical protein